MLKHINLQISKVTGKLQSIILKSYDSYDIRMSYQNIAYQNLLLR